MADYISLYTGEEIDAGIAKANMVYNALPKVSDEGDNLTLDGTANCPMKMELKGNTEQTTYTGKNLLPNSESLSNTGQYQDVIRFTDLEPSTEYTLKVKGTAGDKFYTGDPMPYSSLTIPSNGVLEFTFTTKSTISDLAIIKNTTATNTLPLTECTLCKGSTATYEPYVGGTPSPNPDYPQDVRVVTSNNTINVSGKNLLDKTNNIFQGTFYTSSGGEDSIVEENVRCCTKKINISGKTGSLTYSGQYFDLMAFYDNNNTLISYAQTSTASIPTGATSVRLRFFNNNDALSVSTLQALNLMLENNSSATTYEPYHTPQNYTINLGTIELCKIGSYQDYIYKSNGNWYKHSEIGKVVLNGSEDWNYQSEHHRFSMNLSPRPVDGAMCYATTYIKGQTSSAGSNNTISVASGTGYSKLLIHDERFTTKNDYNNWLSNNNVEVYYVLATPTNEEITDTTLISQLNAIENAVSYDTQTNIVQENYSEPFIINAECVRSLKDIFELIG